LIDKKKEKEEQKLKLDEEKLSKVNSGNSDENKDTS